MKQNEKKFRLLDAILETFVDSLVEESVNPSVSIGNSQYF